MRTFLPRKTYYYGVVYRSGNELTTVAPFDSRPRNPQKWVPMGQEFLGVVQSEVATEFREIAVGLHRAANKSRLHSLEQARELLNQGRRKRQSLARSRYNTKKANSK